MIHGLGQGFERAGAALATPENADVTALLASVDLPELASEGPLGSLALRLDCEADLFRGVALRELARVGWVSRITQTMVVATATCAVAVAACAVVLAVFGGTIEGRLGLLVLAAAVVGAGRRRGGRVGGAHADRAHPARARCARTCSRHRRAPLPRRAHDGVAERGSDALPGCARSPGARCVTERERLRLAAADWRGVIGVASVARADLWFVYLARCADGSLYTGIARNVAERIAQHDAGKGAKYTRGRGPLEVCAVRRCRSRGEALRLELAVKALSATGERIAHPVSEAGGVRPVDAESENINSSALR